MNIKFTLKSDLLENDIAIIKEIQEAASQTTSGDRSLEELLFGKEKTLEDILS